jgi:DMSO/TMAO reductase YedYZ heme-binding membrane subunit
MKKFWTLFDDDNNLNEKAVIGFLAFIVMIVFAVVDIVTGVFNVELLVNEFIFNSFMVITLACFGIASVDKWINKKDKNKEK